MYLLLVSVTKNNNKLQLATENSIGYVESIIP